jgi:hypothetical protein
VKAFHSWKKPIPSFQKAPAPADVAQAALSKFYKFVPEWKKVQCFARKIQHRFFCKKKGKDGLSTLNFFDPLA